MESFVGQRSNAEVMGSRANYKVQPAGCGRFIIMNNHNVIAYRCSVYELCDCCYQCDVPEGGLVPKTLYKEEFTEKSPDGPPLCTASLYQTCHIVKDFPNEVWNLVNNMPVKLGFLQ